MGKVITWTDEMVQMLRELSQEALSATQMAERLGDKFGRKFTRNAIIGKAHRLNLEFGKSVAQKEEIKKKLPAKKPIQILAIKPKKNLVLKTITILAEAPEKPIHAFANPAAVGVNLQEVREGQCKYPLGDVRTNDLLFCGAPANSRHKTYCKYCYSIVYMPLTKYRKMQAKMSVKGN